MPYQYKKQLKAVLAIELLILTFCGVVAYSFWNYACDGTINSCVGDGTLAPGYFLTLSLLRPFVLTPITFFAILAGKSFSPVVAAILTALGGALSTAVIYGLVKPIGRKLVQPWMKSNLPHTLKFIRSQDWKIVLASRLLLFLPFDVLSFFYGAMGFRFKSVAIATFFGLLPETLVYAFLMSPDTPLANSILYSVGIISGCLILPGLAFEFASRKKGTSLWNRLKAMWSEISEEVRMNNDVVKHHQIQRGKVPVLLLYGFFSSRRSLTVLERQLVSRGYSVLSFNLGGLLGVFFTKGIIETANYIDFKLKRQFDRHGIDRINIVSHSKGGLVALWWILKLGGSKHCNKVVTMGTPFKGTYLTWLALVTPLGFFWKDVWQMRPGSNFLKILHELKVPKTLDVFCIYSRNDRVATGEGGVFKPKNSEGNVHLIPMHHVTHFEFMYKRELGDVLAEILGDPAEDFLQSKNNMDSPENDDTNDETSGSRAS